MTNLRQVALLLVLGAALSAQAQKVTLRYNPAVGRSYVYSTTTTMTQTTPQGPSKMNQSMTTTMKVVKKVGDKFQVQTTISGAKVKGTGQGASMGPMIEKNLNGTKSTSLIDSRGRPSDMKTGGSAMMQSAMSGMAGGLGSMNSFPAEPVGVGSKWSSLIDFQKMMKGMAQGMKVTGGKVPVNMVLKSFESKGGKRLAVISVNMKGSFTLNSPQGASMGMGTVTTSMNSSATMKVDVATGLPVEVVSTGGGTTSFGTNKMVQVINTSMKLIK